MRRYIGLLVVAVASVACSQTGPASGDCSQMGPRGDPAEDPKLPPGLRLIVGELGGSGSADGIGAAARFDLPTGVVSDGAGNLYVADLDNQTIRKVVVATGAVTTLAGSTGMTGNTDGTGAAARFAAPIAGALDSAGNLYVMDNQTIRRVVVATGAVTTLAGSPGMTGSADGTGATARFNYPTELALDGLGNLYITDGENNTIRKMVVATGAVTTLAGSPGPAGSTDGTGASARFNSPTGTAMDGTGNLYVSDMNNSTIRKVVLATGEVTTLAGTPGASGSTDGIGAAARFNRPSGMAMDRAGNLYVADTSNHTIRKVMVATRVVTTLAGNPGMLGGDDGIGAAARFTYPSNLGLDGTGNLFVTGLSDTIRKVDLSTDAVTTLAGQYTNPFNHDAGPLITGEGMVADGAGNLFIANYFSIEKVVVATGVATTLAPDPNVVDVNKYFSGAWSIALDCAGNLLFSERFNFAIRKLEVATVATGVVTTLVGSVGSPGSADGTGTNARFEEVTGIAADGLGNLYVADGSSIRKVVIATGAVTTLAGKSRLTGSADGTGSEARFYGPDGLALDGAGNLFVADSGNATIRQVAVATGVVTTLAGSPGQYGSTDGTGADARFFKPHGLAVDKMGNLFVADSNNSTIRKVQTATGVVTTPIGVAGQGGVQLGMLPARLNQPRGVAVLPSGGLFIADEYAVLAAVW